MRNEMFETPEWRNACCARTRTHKNMQRREMKPTNTKRDAKERARNARIARTSAGNQPPLLRGEKRCVQCRLYAERPLARVRAYVVHARVA